MDEQDFSGSFKKIAEIASIGNTQLGKHEFWNLAKVDPATGLVS